MRHTELLVVVSAERGTCGSVSHVLPAPGGAEEGCATEILSKMEGHLERYVAHTRNGCGWVSELVE